MNLFNHRKAGILLTRARSLHYESWRIDVEVYWSPIDQVTNQVTSAQPIE